MLTLKATIATTALVLILGCQPALARKANHGAHKTFHAKQFNHKYDPLNGPFYYSKPNKKSDPRPAAWCGWFLRQKKGIADRAYNLARNWARLGTPAPGPAPGVVAVWRHHVGEVRDVRPGQILLLSGNDGHAVRERWRSVRGVIAWRWV